MAAYQKVGTFKKEGEAKTGGNVAAYFCRPDGTVVHLIPGPVRADVFLREARWAVDVDQAAALDHPLDPAGQRDYLRQAHGRRYLAESRGDKVDVPPWQRAPAGARVGARLPDELPRQAPLLGQAHWLLWADPLPRLGAVYRFVWTTVLGEEVTDAPVRGG